LGKGKKFAGVKSRIKAKGIQRLAVEWPPALRGKLTGAEKSQGGGEGVGD